MHTDLCIITRHARTIGAERGRAARGAPVHVLVDAPQSGIDYMTAAGAMLGDDGRLRFPRALVEDTIAKANRSVTLHSRDALHDLELSGSRVHYGTAGAAVHLVDVEGNAYRESTLQDLHDAARICDALDNIHFCQRPMVARDILDTVEMEVNTVYAGCAGTTKHFGTSFSEAKCVAPALEMLHMIAGGEDKWRERPFVSNSNCFVVPPMKFATDSCEVMEECIRGGMPVLLLSAGMAGATAPSTVAGAIVQAVAWGSGRHCRQQDARHASGLGADVFQRDGGTVGAEHVLRGRGHACVAARVLPRKPDHGR